MILPEQGAIAVLVLIGMMRVIWKGNYFFIATYCTSSLMMEHRLKYWVSMNLMRCSHKYELLHGCRVVHSGIFWPTLSLEGGKLQNRTLDFFFDMILDGIGRTISSYKRTEH